MGERVPYVLALAWLLVALLAYLRYGTSATAVGRRGWFSLSICCYLFSLVASRGNRCSFVLLAIDIYPLRRDTAVRTAPALHGARRRAPREDAIPRRHADRGALESQSAN